MSFSVNSIKYTIKAEMCFVIVDGKAIDEIVFVSVFNTINFGFYAFYQFVLVGRLQFLFQRLAIFPSGFSALVAIGRVTFPS